jgi:hypothetical protein
MGNAPAASVSVTLASSTPAVPYLNHALITFRPEATAFLNAFVASTQDWMFRSPTTNEGLVAELTPDTWQSRLKSLSATSTEPVWLAVDAHFNQLALANSQGTRERLTKPDKVYIGRRTSAVASVNTFTFSTNTAGSVTITINPAKYLYSSSDPAGALAEITVEADGVLTVTDLAADAVAQLNALTDFSAHFLASNVAGVVTITGDVAGYPLIIFVRSTTPGPTMTQAITTANVANAYYDDLTEMQGAAEFGALVDPPSRKFYWITDLQSDDTVNAEGMEWVEDQADAGTYTPIRDYQFVSWSSSGARSITVSGQQVGNFNPSSTESAAANAQQANGGTGWTRGSVWDHDRFEFVAPALLGRTIGYLPGQVSFTSKVLQGGTVASKMAPRDFGDNESLTLGDERAFNWYSAEGPLGSAKWGYLADGSFMDRKWTEDYIRYQVVTDLVQWMQLNNIVSYTNPTIAAGKAVIQAAIAKIPAVIPTSIGVTSLGRDEVNPANIVARVYYDYVGSGQSGGVINRVGTPSDPIAITISETP